MDPLTMFVMLMMENVHVKIILMVTIVTRVQKAGGISQIQRVRVIIQTLDYWLKKKIIITILFLFSECLCHADGAVDIDCTEDAGICTCKPNIVGEKCDKAAPGYYNFPEVIRKYIC